MEYDDEYQAWASDYDLFGEISNINLAERDFLVETFFENETKSILDCACGTGQHLIMLRELGYDIAGSDYSEAMLAICRKNLKKFDLDVPIRHGDYRCLKNIWKNKFDTILCLTSSLLHMHNQADLLAALSSMRERLNEKGILIITQGTTHKTLEEQFRFDLVVNNVDFSRLFVRDIEDDFQIVHILDIFHDELRNEMKQHVIKIKIVLDEEYKSLLQEAGFSAIDIYGGYDKSPYNVNESMRLVVVAKA